MMSPLLHLIAHLHQRPLVDAGVLVRALELHQPVDVDARLGRIRLVGRADDDTGGVHLVDHAGAAGRDGGAGIARDHALHAGADERRLGVHERHRLPLHVGAHERAVGVIVLEERNERRGHRNELLRRHVHIVDLIGRQEHHVAVAAVAADDQVFGEAALGIDRRVGLGDRVTPLLHRRQIMHLFGDPAVLHLAVRRFDEAVFVHPRIGRKRIDQADVRAFRRLDRADAAVMGRVHVAHLEAGALAGQTARAKRGEAPLVGDLRQRVGLIHELRELRRAEELAHRRRRRLGVDQILRHHRVDIDRRHALLDRALHAQQADAILIFHQLADRAHPAIAEMVDIVDVALAVAQIDQRLDHRQDVFLAQGAHGVLGGEIEPHIHLHAADRGEIVALRIEEQRVEHRLRGIERRRLAWAHHAIDVEQRLFARHVLVDRERIANVGADIDVIDVEERQLLVAGIVQRLERLLGDLFAGFDVDLAVLRIDEVLGEIVADQFLLGQAQGLEAFFGELPGLAHGELLAGLEHHLAGIGVDQIVDRLIAAQPVGIEGHAPAFLRALVKHLLVEGVEDLLAAHAERIEERRHRDFAAAIDARIDNVLGVELDVEPGAAIGDDAGREQELARRMGLALVVIEEHARRAMHLRDDDALGAIDDEGAVIGHERDVAHVDILLLDVLDRFGAGFLVDIEHDEAQSDLERRRIGHAALPALVDIVFRALELVLDEFEHGDVGEVGNREDRFEHGLQSLVGTAAVGLLHQQELVVGRLLNLNEVRHLRDFLDFSEKLPNALPTDKRLRHMSSRSIDPSGSNHRIQAVGPGPCGPRR